MQLFNWDKKAVNMETKTKIPKMSVVGTSYLNVFVGTTNTLI